MVDYDVSYYYTVYPLVLHIFFLLFFKSTTSKPKINLQNWVTTVVTLILMSISNLRTFVSVTNDYFLLVTTVEVHVHLSHNSVISLLF